MNFFESVRGYRFMDTDLPKFFAALEELVKQLKENNRLLEENNALLREMNEKLDK